MRPASARNRVSAMPMNPPEKKNGTASTRYIAIR